MIKAIKPKVDDIMASAPIGLKKEKSKPIYPTIRIQLEHLPEAKNWKLGEMHCMELKVKLIGLSQSRFDNSAEFEIQGIDPESTKMEDAEKEDEDD